MRLQLIAALALALVACADPNEGGLPPEPDRCAFDRDVYPVLARDCGFPSCHGSADRFFQVWAPGRARLDPETAILAAPTEAERARSYDRARSMLATPGDAEPPLLRKPLARSAGGGAHMGRDALGRNVYPDREAEGWRVLATWARGEGAACP